MTIEIFHNPRCSKSRATLALLQEHGYEPTVRLYLEDPPSRKEVKAILDKLGITARELLRKGEAEYRDLGLADPALGESALIAAMTANGPRGYTLGASHGSSHGSLGPEPQGSRADPSANRGVQDIPGIGA